MTGNKHYESPKLDYLEIDLGGSGSAPQEKKFTPTVRNNMIQNYSIGNNYDTT